MVCVCAPPIIAPDAPAAGKMRYSPCDPVTKVPNPVRNRVEQQVTDETGSLELKVTFIQLEKEK